MISKPQARARMPITGARLICRWYLMMQRECIHPNYWPIFPSIPPGHPVYALEFCMQVLRFLIASFRRLVRLRWWFLDRTVEFSVTRTWPREYRLFNNDFFLSSSCICFACLAERSWDHLSAFKGFCICLPFLGTNVWLYYINAGIWLLIEAVLQRTWAGESWEPDLPSWRTTGAETTLIFSTTRPQRILSIAGLIAARWRADSELLYEISVDPTSE